MAHIILWRLQHLLCMLLTSGVAGLQFPDPVIKIAIEPASKQDNQKMTDALIKLSQEDPSFHFSRDDETNQTVIEGMGELHLVCHARRHRSRSLLVLLKHIKLPSSLQT